MSAQVRRIEPVTFDYELEFLELEKSTPPK
jgi:hypothetical protein